MNSGYRSNIESQASAGEKLIMNANGNINLEAASLNAKDNIILNATNDINITAVNDIAYSDSLINTKGSFGRSKSERNMTYKESVVSSTLNAENIVLKSGNNINLEAAIIKADEEKIAYAKNNLNIISKSYKEAELHQTKKSSFGGLIKSEYKFEKDHLKIKASEITADNLILNAKEINIQASNIKANSADITADIMNLFSSKERLFVNEFSIKGGVLTATIETNGKIEETIIPSTIEINNKIIFNKIDITSQLDSKELIKTLSSQGELSIAQINLVKELINNDEWHTKTTTLSGVGALVVQAVVTYFTAGAGTALAAGITNAAIQAATQAAIQAVVVQATTSLVTSAITGNSLKLDIKSLAKSAITAGVLSYANGLSQMNDLNLGETTQKFVQTTVDTTIKTGINSAVYGTDFEDSLVSNLVTASTNLLAKEAFKEVGDTSMTEEVINKNDSFVDGGLSKTLLHTATGAGIAAIKNENILVGALSAGVREATSTLTSDSSQEMQLLISQLTGISVGALVDGEDGAKTGMDITTSAELFNRQFHQKEIEFIKKNTKAFASTQKRSYLAGREYTISDEKARKILVEAANYMVDYDSKEKSLDRLAYVVVQGVSRAELEAGIKYLSENSKGNKFMDTYKESMKVQDYFTSTTNQFKNNSWIPDSTIGLGDQSLSFVPATKVGQVLGGVSKTVGPIILRKVDGVYDSTTFGVTNVVEKAVPTLLKPNNAIKGIAGVEIVNDVLNTGSPIPNGIIGTILSGIKNTKDLIEDENKINDIKNVLKINNQSNENE